VENRLFWVVENALGTTRRDPFQPGSPQNRSTVNIFSTGPDFTLPFGRRTGLQLSGRYRDRRFEEAGRLDSSEVSANAGLYRQLSPTTRLGLFADWRTIEYDDEGLPGVPTVPEYDIFSAYVSYDRRLASGSASVQVGGNRLERGDFESDGTFFRVNWTRELTARSRLRVQLGQRFSDAGDIFFGNRLDALATDRPEDVILTRDPLTRTDVGVDYALTFPRTRLNAGLSWAEDDFEQSDVIDNERWLVRARMSRDITRRLDLSVALRFQRREFDVTPQRDDDLQVRVSLGYPLGQRFRISGGYEYAERDANLGDSFEENRFFVNIGLVVWDGQR
jgi:hypothetical protein